MKSILKEFADSYAMRVGFINECTKRYPKMDARGAGKRFEWMIKNGYEHEAMAMWMKVKITN